MSKAMRRSLDFLGATRITNLPAATANGHAVRHEQVRAMFGAQFTNFGRTLIPADAQAVEGRFAISGTITRWTVKTKGGTVSAQFDLRVANYSASSNPGSGDSIVGANAPKVTSGVNADSTSFTGWSTTTVTAGQAWSVVLSSVAGDITYAEVIFEITPS